MGAGYWQRKALLLLPAIFLASCGSSVHSEHTGRLTNKPSLGVRTTNKGKAIGHVASPTTQAAVFRVPPAVPQAPQDGGLNAAYRWLNQGGWDTPAVKPVKVPGGYLLSGNVPWAQVYVNQASGKWVPLPPPMGSMTYERETANGGLMFLAEGAFDSAYRPFPTQLWCLPQPDGTFVGRPGPMYFPLSESATFGNIRREVLTSVYASAYGLKLSFGPEPGDNGAFFAGFMNVPLTKTTYDAPSNTLVLDLADTELGQINDLNAVRNQYVSSVRVIPTASGIEVRISLDGGAHYFNGRNDVDPKTQYPYLDLYFFKTAPVPWAP